MGIKVVTNFIDRATVRIVVYVHNDEDALVEPTAVKVYIWAPSGEDPIVNGTDIVATGRVEDGVYEYCYHMDTSADAMAEGEWKGQISVIDGVGADGVISPTIFSFTVESGIR